MDKRGTRRISVKREATFTRNGASTKCFLISVSENGLQLIVPHSQKLNGNRREPFTLTLAVSSSRAIEIQCREVWSDGDIVGAHIKDPPADYRTFYRQSYFKIKKELSHDSIAVIGVGCYYPGAPTLKTFWENILSRRREFRRLPERRLPLSDYYDSDPSVPDKTYGDRAAVIDGFSFDWVKRGIPKSVVESSDIVHWLALEVAIRALEDAGYSRQKTPCDRTGVILGNTLTGEHSRSQNMRLRWPYVSKIVKAAAAKKGLSAEVTEDLLRTMEGYYKSAFAPITEDTLAGNLSNTIAGRICNFLDLHGGGYTVDGACSSSLIAVATAASALSNSTLDLAIAGGIDISLDTFELVGFAKTKALTREDMRVYDKKASGFIPGEGAGFVVLKRLQDARMHGNYVYAVLRGWGISSDGKGGITAPKAEAQALAIKRAYGKAGYDLSSVDFIEGHGTGTAAGDRAEVEGISMVMDPGRTAGLRTCGVTSLKSLIGHTKAASGIGGFIKAVMAVNRRVIPPTAGCSEPNAVFQDKARALFPVMHGEVHDANRVMRAGVSGMGFGGINCHVTVESGDPPASALDTAIGERELLASWQETEVFALSAQDRHDMAEKIQGLKKLAYGISSSEMADLSSHLTQDVNVNGSLRAAIIAHSPDNLIDCLDRALRTLDENEITEGTVLSSPREDVWIGRSLKAPRTGFLFPGQGSQQLGMGRTLIERYGWAADLAGRIDPILSGRGYKKIIEAVYPPVDRARDAGQVKEWKKALSETDLAQPSICLASVLWMRRLERLGIVPHAAGGHSLGELTAFYAAGAFPDTELILFAAFRGMITSARGGVPGAMASLACDGKKAGEILGHTGGYAVIANMNSPAQTVISGETKAIDEAIARAESLGIAAKRLPVSNAFHSRFMENAANILAKDAPIGGTLDNLKVRLFTSTDGSTVAPGVDMKQHFSRQLTHTVDFITLVRNMANDCDILIEAGPGKVLTDLARSITDKTCLPVEAREGDDRSLNTIVACHYVNGGAVRWPALFENRLIRPFVPVSRRVFIENPCERPALPTEAEAFASAEASRASVSEGVREEAAPKAAPVASETPARLIALASEMTGFPVESISLDHRLLDDLNLDSIKAGQFVARAIKLFGAEGKIDPTASANSSLKEIFERVRAAEDKASLPALAKPSPKTAPGDAWVRDFAVKYVTRPLIGAEDLRQKNILIVSDQGQGIGAGIGLQATVMDYSELPLDSGELRRYDQFVFILPDNSGQDGGLSANGARQMAGRLHSIAKAITLLRQRNPKPSYAVVQYGGTDFYRPGNAPISSRGAAAFISSLHHENPEAFIRVLQFSENGPQTLKKTIEELNAPETFAMAVYDSDLVRRVPVLTPIGPGEFTPRPVKWTAEDVVLVTGGARGITAECALAFAQKTNVKLAIAGRIANPGADPETRENLRRYAENGVECRYYACDITDEFGVKALVRRIESELGPITGFIHGAAVNRPRRIEQVTLKEAMDEIGPKVIGAINVLDALKAGQLKLAAALGSIIGVTGMAGNAWYAFSNEVLNILLQRLKKENPATETITCAFSVWDEVGMGARMGSIENLSRMGIHAIPKDKGVEHFMRLVQLSAGEPQIVVASRLGALDTMRSPMTARGRFIEDVLFFEKGVEIEAKAVLTIERDRYLEDHVFRGTRLFPTVFGIEAMQQAVLAVTGAETGHIEMEDVNLSYPITVEPGGQTEIRVRALVNEPSGGPMKVKASIAVDQTAFGKNHFEATFVIRNEMTAPQAAPVPEGQLGIEPREDLYGHMLFQGPSFQRIERILSMTDDQCVFEASARPSGQELAGALGPFAAGDPYFRDTLLQSGQIILPHLVALPVRIKKWEIYRTKESGRNNVTVDILERRSDTIVADVVAAGPDGRVVERIEGYVIKIIELKKDAPAVSDLISPDKWDEGRVNARIRLLCGEIDAAPPAISLRHIPGLSGMARLERHSVERPLFQGVCQTVSPNRPGVTGPAEVFWTEQGKPFLPENSEANLSCSHDAKLLICSASSTPHGCDVEPVAHRDPDEWALMLGIEKRPMLDILTKNGDSYDRAATRLWSAMEALRKATDMRQSGLTYTLNTGDAAVFSGDEGMMVITFPVRLLRGPERMIAVAVQKNRAERGAKTASDPVHPLSPGHEATETGPEGQRVFSCVFPLGLRDNSTVSGGVNFANYANWLGNVREAALKPIGKYISDEFFSGHFMVTNLTDTRIIRHVRNHENIEGRVWVDRISGYGDSSITLKLEWRKIAASGAIPVAFSRHQVSWIKVVGHGLVEPVECPPFFAAFIKDTNMAPKRAGNDAAGGQPAEVTAPLEHGELVAAYDLIGAGRRIAAEATFETTTQNSNLAQNIYFSNYFAWQGHLLDRYLFGLEPKLFMSMSPEGQFASIRTHVTHLREAMPFDRIAVTMQIERVRRRAVNLYFEYFRLAPDGEKVKLAYGHHTLIWASIDGTDRYVPQDIPEAFLRKMTS